MSIANSPEVQAYESLRSEILDRFDITAGGAHLRLYEQIAALHDTQPDGYNTRTDDLIARVFRPEVSADPEALENLKYCLDNDIPVISLADHVFLTDHLNDKAAYMSIPGLERIIDEGMILAKASYFFVPDKTGKFKRKLAETYLDQKAVAVFRPQDVVPLLPESQQGDESYIRRLLGSKALSGFIHDQLEGGGFLHIYPESTRNHDRPREILEVRGLALKVIKNLIRNEREFAVMFTGRSYGHSRRTSGLILPWNSPNIHIDNLVIGSEMTEEQKANLVDFCSEGMLKAKTKAYEKRGVIR